LLWSPLWLPFFGVKANAFLPYQHGFGGLGPMIAAFATTAIFGKKGDLRALWQSLFRWQPLVWTLAAIFVAFHFRLACRGDCPVFRRSLMALALTTCFLLPKFPSPSKPHRR
jgi:hypothetical protein